MVGGCLPMSPDLEMSSRQVLGSQASEVQRNLLHPELLPLLLLPPPRRPPLHLPHPSLAALGLGLLVHENSLALLAHDRAVSVDQLTALLRLLFPDLRQDTQLEKCLKEVFFQSNATKMIYLLFTPKSSSLTYEIFTPICVKNRFLLLTVTDCILLFLAEIETLRQDQDDFL